MHGAVGPFGVGGEVAEQVHRQRLGRQQVGPEALVVEALMGLDERRAGPRRRDRLRGEERRSALRGEVEVELAADQTRRRARTGSMGPYGMAVGLAPHRVVVADRAAELSHSGLAWQRIMVEPAVRGLELRL